MPPRSSLSDMIAQKRQEAKQQQQQQQQQQQPKQDQASAMPSSPVVSTNDDNKPESKSSLEWDAVELGRWLHHTTPRQRAEAVVVAYDDILATKCHIASNGRYPERPNRLSRSMELLRSRLERQEHEVSSGSSTATGRIVRRMPPPNISDLKVFLQHLNMSIERANSKIQDEGNKNVVSKEQEQQLQYLLLDKSDFTQKEANFLATLIHTSPELRRFLLENKPLENISTDLFIDEHTSLEGTLRAAALTIEATRGVWKRSQQQQSFDHDDDSNNISSLDQWKHAFALIRPPGHHSGPHRCHGFCLVNHVAAAAASLIFDQDSTFTKKPKKIAIIDIDVHHGDGTQLICDELMRRKQQNGMTHQPHEEQDQILFFSMHRYDQGSFFPGTGHLDNFGEFGLNFNLGFDTFCAPSVLKQIKAEKLKKKQEEEEGEENLNDEKGNGDDENTATPTTALPLLDKYPFYKIICDDTVRIVVDDFLLPLLFTTSASFKPDIILVSCGFDAADGDPLGGQGVSKFGYRYIFERLAKMGCCRSDAKYAPGIVAVLEGGYDVEIVSNYFTEVVMNGLASPKENHQLQAPSHWEKGRKNFVDNANDAASTDDDHLRKLNQEWTRKTILELCEKYVEKNEKGEIKSVNENLLKFCSAYVLKSRF